MNTLARVLCLVMALTAGMAGADELVGKRLVGSWVFDKEHVGRGRVKAAFGELDGVITGKKRLQKHPPALRLDGTTNEVIAAEDIAGANLPTRGLTVEAWVSIDKPMARGGIVGAFQDNGGYEKGWVLGFRDSSFCFGLAAEESDDGDGVLTYVTSPTLFEPGRWYHVVGTYGGGEMRLYVNGELKGATKEQSGAVLYPEKAVLSIGSYHDDDELFYTEGRVLEVRLYQRALRAEEVEDNYAVRDFLFPSASGVVLGPYLQFAGRDKAVVRWRSDRPGPSVVEYRVDGQWRRATGEGSSTKHAVELTGLKRNTMHPYRMVFGTRGDARRSPDYECDTTFNYTLPAMPERLAKNPKEAVLAARIVSRTGVTQGYCLVLGCARRELAYELAAQTNLYVMIVDTDAEAVQTAREALAQAGAYGARLTVHHVPDLAQLPFTQCFANLIVAGGPIEDARLADAGELYRVLRPLGGTLCLVQDDGAPNLLSEKEIRAWLDPLGVPYQVARDAPGLWCMLKRGAIEGAGEWSHQYGTPDNSARSGEWLQGVTRTDGLEAQWVGRPGPRAMVDRNPRKPSPLYTNGRLFTQGLHRIIAQDAYNGAIYWSLEIPALQRFNMPRDCGNWCADADRVYVAIDDACWVLDAASGALEDVHWLSALAGVEGYDWGYVANVGDTLFGSGVRAETTYTNYWGAAREGWYDSPTGPVTKKVCSDFLFAFGKGEDRLAWKYEKGLILNPTITIAEGRVYFVECRNPDAAALPARRVGGEALWRDQYLVALDADTGQLIWERAIDTVDGTVVFYMIHANDTLVVALSDKKYHIYGFDAADGAQKWEGSHDWTGEDHSGHMQHPAVVGNVVYLEPCGYDMTTGERVTEAVGRHEGCATYSATQNALILRGKGRCIALWDAATEESTTWERLRPGCWLSTVSGGGMVLSPEGGGGCSCGGWMETSLAFLPRAER
ncbi:MAG: PQQ-binding-like beta-propeller repeat protein [Nitrospiraceae bacterium]|nr:PQQ-binding-like beta-propeller repeat protein [Nitrospiraceae bacterium]